jgi:hypothetical protein
MDMEAVVAELTARLEALEEVVEELRYAGPSRGVNTFTEDYADYADGEWDAL